MFETEPSESVAAARKQYSFALLNIMAYDHNSSIILDGIFYIKRTRTTVYILSYYYIQNKTPYFLCKLRENATTFIVYYRYMYIHIVCFIYFFFL